ncbi:MAG TPA: DMT family transporter [Solirubrobacteraceae bacterium]|jgi:drug/metabolite transporter (DMT)-like permease|nr:DMT family transporter [Solirubrobacteraceae bacterium]
MKQFRNPNLIPILALAGAGALWGLTVPLSKLALPWLPPAWLTSVRFLIAIPVLALAGRGGLRQALRPRVVGAGALGFGAVLVLQNAGIARTSVSHAALLVGAVPVLVALFSAARGQASRRPLIWLGYALALAGIGLVAGYGGGGASDRGDLLVIGSAVLSALFIYLQPGVLGDRDPAAVTAVQFAGGLLVSMPLALLTEPTPAASASGGSVAAVLSLGAVGTVLPFWLFAYGQSKVSAQQAGAFVNLEPVVGAAVGWVAFGNPASIVQIVGAAGVVLGILLSGLPDVDHEPGEGGRPDSRPPSLRLSWNPAEGR